MDKFKRFAVDALIAALAVAVAVLIGVGIKRESDRNARDRETAAREDEALRESQALGMPIYEELASSARAVEGVVFWGDDSLTDNPESSLPVQLSNRIGDALFSPVFDELTELTGLRLFQRVLIPVANQGASDEGLSEILVRTGARDMALGRDLELPAMVLAKDVELVDEVGERLLFASQRHADFGEVSLMGIDGGLYTGSDQYDPRHPWLAFARARAGEAVTIPAGTVMRLQCQERYRSYRTVLFFHEHPEVGSRGLVEVMRALLERQRGHEKQYVVVCTTVENSELDALLTWVFGDHYIRNDRIPEAMGVVHLQRLSRRVYEVLDRYGTFDDVKTGVTEAREALARLREGT